MVKILLLTVDLCPRWLVKLFLNWNISTEKAYSYPAIIIIHFTPLASSNPDLIWWLCCGTEIPLCTGWITVVLVWWFIILYKLLISYLGFFASISTPSASCLVFVGLLESLLLVISYYYYYNDHMFYKFSVHSCGDYCYLYFIRSFTS